MTKGIAREIFKMVSQKRKVSVLQGKKSSPKDLVILDEDEETLKIGKEHINYKSIISVGRDWIRVEEK